MGGIEPQAKAWQTGPFPLDHDSTRTNLVPRACDLLVEEPEALG